jgi:hypothetical protein
MLAPWSCSLWQTSSINGKDLAGCCAPDSGSHRCLWTFRSGLSFLTHLFNLHAHVLALHKTETSQASGIGHNREQAGPEAGFFPNKAWSSGFDGIGFFSRIAI